MYPLLSETSPALYLALLVSIRSLGRGEVTDQLHRVVIPPQGLVGARRAFSVLVRVLVHLNFQQRPSESLEFHVLDGTVVLDLDDRSQICRIKLRELPDEFSRFETAARSGAP